MSVLPSMRSWRLKTYWTNFAKRGFPSSSGSPFWPFFNNLTQKMQSLVLPAPQTETDSANTHNCAFWTALEGAHRLARRWFT